MRVANQFVIVAMVAVLGVVGWYFKDRLPFLATPPQAAAPGATVAARGIPVETVPSRLMEVTSTVEAMATAHANEAITVTAKTAGIVQRISFQDGQKVPAGTTLIELEAQENDARIAELKAARDNASQLLDRAQQLLATRNVPAARVDELQKLLEAADARMQAEVAKRGDLVIRAPFAGKLGLRQVSLGALVRPGEPITTLDDTSIIKLDFEVPETALPGLATGQKVNATSAAVPGRRFEGIVSIIDSRIDPVTRAVKVRALIPNADEALKPGMFLIASLVTGRRSQAVVVPEEAVLASAGQQYVYVVRDGRAFRTRVSLGQRLPGAVEIVEGLGADAEIIVGGLQQVRDGLPVRPTGPAAARSPAS